MKPLTSSIRRQLLCWLLVPIMTLWVVGSIITYVLAIDFAESAYDSALLDSGRAVASRLVFKGTKVSIDLPPAAQSVLKWNDKDDFYYQVLDADGNLISGDASIPASDRHTFSARARYRDARIGSRDVRIVSFHVPVPDEPNRRVTVQVAETLNGIDELSDKVLLGVVLPQLALIALAALAVWFGVARGLRPLQEIKQALSDRSPSDLRPLPAESAPKEVKPLVLAINKLLFHVDDDREAQKRFLANAAHQLRTPLAGLKMQTELAERAATPEELQDALRNIRRSSDRAARLVQQLLTLAKVEPGRGVDLEKQPVDLNAIAKEATAGLVCQALPKSIDLGFEGGAEACTISGNAESIFELCTNLIDNAILYTQPGGRITVRVNNEDRPTLSVEDNGPGIPLQERERVFDRFYRPLGTGATGSGLGLSIVREIANQHGAGVQLTSGPDDVGTNAVVVFDNLPVSPVS